MKKIISLLLALIMLISFSIPAFAYSELKEDETTGEFYEKFTFNFGSSGFDVTTVGGINFDVTVGWHFSTEVCGGGRGKFTKICTKEGKELNITRVEARVTSYGSYYGEVGVTAGEKREKGRVSNGTIVHIDDIVKSEFAFDGGTDYVCFDLIKVYYECAGEHTLGTNGKCKVCGAEMQHQNASIFSEGNTMIIAGVAVVVIAVAAVVIVKKKKKKAAAAAETAEEAAETEQKEE